jgi:hypothetical protein
MSAEAGQRTVQPAPKFDGAWMHSILSPSLRERAPTTECRARAPWAVLRLITSSNLVVRGHSDPTQQRHTGLGCAGYCAPLFATCWNQPLAAWVGLSSLP